MTGRLWDSPLRAAADVVRLAGMVSFVVALTMGGIETALFALVLLGLTLLRLVGVAAALDLATGVWLVLAAWFALLDYYLRYQWLDVLVHLSATGLVSVAVFALLVKVGAAHRPDSSGLARPRLAAVLLTVALGLALGVLWELGEWFGHTYLDGRIQTGYDDTIGDLASGGVGALLAGLLNARRSPVTAWQPARRRRALADVNGG
jgi:hypothetical protein